MTYTALAVDTGHGVLGIATASYSLAVGNAVPALDPATGIVATQAWTNRILRSRGLELLDHGTPPAAVIERFALDDPGFQFRQVAVMDRQGRVAAHTGTEVSQAAGHLLGPGYAVLGNFVTTDRVLEAMQVAMSAPVRDASDVRRTTTEPEHLDASGRWVGGLDPAPVVDLALRLLDALRAGQAAGGDKRGHQSASLQVARVYPGRLWPAEVDIDLRVDESRDPLRELERVLLVRIRGPRAARPPGWEPLGSGGLRLRRE